VGFLISDAAARAMYAGGRGNATARRYARFWAWIIAHRLMPRRWVVLDVVGRTSGRIVSLPLGMTEQDGRWYLVPVLGGRSNWVLNVRAAAGRAHLRGRLHGPVRLVEIPVAERAPIIKRYLQIAPGGRPHIPVDRNAPLSAFEAIADRYPVFRVEFEA
jgi:F420H(2)-dependent quinone reductase